MGRHLAELSPDRTPVEVGGTFGSTAQVHPALADRWLGYPPSTGEAGWRGLTVALDPDTGQPVLADGESRPLLPFFAGTIPPMALPGLVRFLIALGAPYAIGLPIIDLLDAKQQHRRTAVQAYRECRLGSVVAARAAWCVDTAAIPMAEAGEGRFRFLCRIRRWARAMGLPDLVYARPVGVAAGLSRARYRKPFLVEWTDPHSLDLLARYRRGVERFALTEMRPKPDELPRVAGRRHVAEWVVEAYDV